MNGRANQSRPTRVSASSTHSIFAQPLPGTVRISRFAAYTFFAIGHPSWLERQLLRYIVGEDALVAIDTVYVDESARPVRRRAGPRQGLNTV
jgi:hypothetical protein